ncbi:MAG: PAS domain S-box protein, partial [Spirochaeta sp.]|nr:PAS domain S-box protein [Spirochaeta sp.]
MGADAGSNQQVRELQKRIQQLETEGRNHTSVLEDLSSHQEELRLQNEQLRDTQTDLETARQRFEALFEFLPVGVLLLDRSGVIRELNHAVVDLIGRRKEHLLDHPALPLFDTTDYQQLSENLGAAAGGAMREMLANLRRQSGETLRVELRLAPMHTRDCRNHVYLTLLDVGRREEALSRLEESEARFRSMIEHTPHGVCITRTDGTFEYVNDAYCDIYGYTADELVGQPFTVVVPEEHQAELEHAHATFMEQKTEFAGTHRVR